MWKNVDGNNGWKSAKPTGIHDKNTLKAPNNGTFKAGNYWVKTQRRTHITIVLSIVGSVDASFINKTIALCTITNSALYIQ